MARILILSDGITPFVTGGMQKHSAMLAKLFTLQGHSVTLMHCVSSQLNIPSETEVNIALFGAGSNQQVDATFGFHFPKTNNFPGHYIHASKSYSQLMLSIIAPKLEKFDFIYAQGFTGWAFIKHKSEHPNSPPLFTNLHGLEMFQHAPSIKVKLQHYLLRPMAKIIIRSSDYTFSFGGKLTEILKSLNVPEDRIIECSHGITSDWLSSDKNKSTLNPIRFVFIGRYERRKGIEELSATLIELIKNPRLEFAFSFIGDIPAEKHVKDSRIIYHGKISNQEHLKSIVQNSDVLVCPSYSEGMPTVIFEAMASGLAIIATDVGAVNQQVSSKNGWLLSHPSKVQIKASMKEAIMLNHEQLLLKKNNSKRLVRKKFIWEEVINDKLELIEKKLAIT